ncbi:MAG: hypothetical protein ACI3XM_03245, partial [Eubacteriales bacterium]
IFGMLLGVPLAAAVYRLLKEDLNQPITGTDTRKTQSAAAANADVLLPVEAETVPSCDSGYTAEKAIPDSNTVSVSKNKTKQTSKSTKKRSKRR